MPTQTALIDNIESGVGDLFTILQDKEILNAEVKANYPAIRLALKKRNPAAYRITSVIIADPDMERIFPPELKQEVSDLYDTIFSVQPVMLQLQSGEINEEMLFEEIKQEQENKEEHLTLPNVIFKLPELRFRVPYATAENDKITIRDRIFAALTCSSVRPYKNKY